MSDLSGKGLAPKGDSFTWVPERLAATPPRRSVLRLVALAGGVLAVHAALLVLLVRQTYQAPIVLANTEPPASVRVSLVQARPPQPVAEAPPPAAPPVLTTEHAERSVAPPAPVPPAQPPTPPPKPKPKPAARPKPAPSPATVPAERPLPSPVEKAPSPPPSAAPAGPVANEASGEKLLDLPSSGPKDVQTVGCRIPAPAYPRRALRQRLEGVVMVQLVIDPQGRVQNAAVVHSSGSQELDAAALAAVSAASCNPHVENGRAIAVRASQPVSFRLNR